MKLLSFITLAIFLPAALGLGACRTEIDTNTLAKGDDVVFYAQNPLFVSDSSAVVGKNATIKVGQCIVIHAEPHHSTGYGFELDCDKAFFDVDFNSSYVDPNHATMRGGDRLNYTYRLTARKRGQTVITERHLWRGKEYPVTITVTVN